jgi:hypothetical protein
MSKLSDKERNALPASAFVFPAERSFPIPDRSHAYDALRMANKETPERAAIVRDKVLRRFNIGSSGAQVQSR